MKSLAHTFASREKIAQGTATESRTKLYNCGLKKGCRGIITKHVYAPWRFSQKVYCRNNIMLGQTFSGYFNQSRTSWRCLKFTEPLVENEPPGSTNPLLDEYLRFTNRLLNTRSIWLKHGIRFRLKNMNHLAGPISIATLTVEAH